MSPSFSHNSRRYRNGLALGLPALALATLGLGSNPTQAGIAVLDSSNGDTATFEYREDMLRINNSTNASAYAVVRDGSLFSVTINDGQPMVIDAGSMLKGMGAMQLPTVASELDGKLISFEDTGDNETIAGITGDVYEVVFEEDGERRSETMVLSSDERVREFSNAMFSMMNFAANLTSAQAQEQGAEFRERLDDMDAGILRFGSEMKISSISGETVPVERFELPAQPMNFEGLGSMLQNISKQQQAQQSQSSASGSSQSTQSSQKSQGNLLSTMIGALGGKKGEAKPADTAEKKENPLGKTFGKLFGKDKDKDNAED